MARRRVGDYPFIDRVTRHKSTAQKYAEKERRKGYKVRVISLKRLGLSYGLK